MPLCRLKKTYFMAMSVFIVINNVWLVAGKSGGVKTTDEKPITVQDDCKENCRTGRLWVYISPGGTV